MTLHELLVLHASPTLANLKPASLVCLKTLDGQSEDLCELEKRGLSFLWMTSMTGCPLLLVYRRNALARTLATPKARSILAAAGCMGSLDDMLDHLCRRFASCRCPHEIGLFLGYPEDDVDLFIRNDGKKAVCCLFWKVYCDVEGALKLARKWDKCRKCYIECFRNGFSITRLCVSA